VTVYWPQAVNWIVTFVVALFFRDRRRERARIEPRLDRAAAL